MAIQQSSSMQHQMMGYDRSSTMFSPDGRLLQVEYAKKAVKQGTASIGLVCKDGVVLLADKRVVEQLVIPASIEKVFQVDDHIGVSSTGFLMDARVLVERAQTIAQQHRVTYDGPIDILTLVKDVANLKQSFTQYGGARPFGVSLLFASVDDGVPSLYMTDVTGIFFQYKATAIGEFDAQLKEILEKRYKESMTCEQGVKLAMDAFKEVLAKDFDVSRLDGAFVSVQTGQFTRLPLEQLRKLSK